MPKITPWTRTDLNTLLKTPIFKIGSHQSGNGEKEGTFYTMQAPDWVNVLALTEDEEVILVRQFRQGTNEVTLEIPGGGVDAFDDDPLIAAQRELQEETGYTAKKWTKLGTTSVNPAFMTNHCHMFLAEGCRKTHNQQLDSMEEIQIERISFKSFFSYIEEETIDHSLIIAAVGRYLLRKSDK